MSLIRYAKTLLTGNTNASIDGIDGAILNDGYVCEYFSIDHKYGIYKLKADSNAPQNVPLIITPVLNPGSKRWHLQNAEDLIPYESTMTGNETFAASYTYQKRGTYILDAGGTDRNFNPSGTFSKGFEARIINIGGENIVFDSTVLAEVVPPLSAGTFVYDGNLWTW